MGLMTFDWTPEADKRIKKLQRDMEEKRFAFFFGMLASVITQVSANDKDFIGAFRSGAMHDDRYEIELDSPGLDWLNSEGEVQRTLHNTEVNVILRMLPYYVQRKENGPTEK